MGKSENLIGKRFGSLTVISFSHSKNAAYWACKCDCGKSVLRCTGALNRNLGYNKNCGGIAHDYSRTRLYGIYRNMRSRCENPNAGKFKDYGGRGIKICDEWAGSFKTFANWASANGYKENLTIDRIDNNGNYEPSNCRWVDNFVQQNNTRANRLITCNGLTLTARGWDRHLGVNIGFIQNRLSKGFTEYRAINQPPRGRKK